MALSPKSGKGSSQDDVTLENINILSDYNKFIFVFDFDMTLTTKSSNGINLLNPSGFINLFDSEEKINQLKKTLNLITEHNHKIYINTRGLVTDIQFILKNIGLVDLFSNIMGSEYVEQINQPFTNYELEEYGLDNSTDVQMLWSIKKVLFLDEICKLENVSKDNILFFDDARVNIKMAKINGYNFSFLIGNSDCGFIGLDYLFIKLGQILGILNL